MDSMDYLGCSIIFIAAVFAAGFGTLIGGSSIVTIPALILLGLPPHTAIGTDRFGIIGVGISGWYEFHRKRLIDYRIGLGPIPMTWRSRIEQWEPGAGFVDAQLKGPYRSWWHEHRFEAHGDRTVMVDRVHYAAPLGPLGLLANRLFVQPMLRRIFGYRSDVIEQRFGPETQETAARAA